MAKKQFKTESKKLLDMMVNSIYTHKEIFLRELISNASDAIDKLYFRSLTDSSVTIKRDEYEIRIETDKISRTLTISDNGCGMTAEELESNLGTIAKSGSFDFKNNPEHKDENIDIIGQFGVGFYSAFMVSDKITVISRAYDEETGYKWESEGADGYTISDCKKDTNGTVVMLHIMEDTDDEKYSDYLSEYRLRSLVKMYSDYIRYPIRMEVEHEVKKEGTEDEYETVTETETFNSMIPIWKREQKDVTDDEYAGFYTEKFMDYEKPLKVIRQKAEGTTSYEALLFIPSHAPFDYYTREYEKGLQLYSSGVMIMEKCKELVPDYFSFVHGLVDSDDFTLNISRETLQHDRQLKVIAKALEKKIAGELAKMLENEREKYEQFFTAFGTQIKYGLYSDFGMHKEVLQDLVMFTSSLEKKPVTLREYTDRMKDDQKKIYYATGESADMISMLPQVEAVIAKGYEVLCLTDDIDEFAIQMLRTYAEKEFANVCKDDTDIATDEEKERLKKENEDAKPMLQCMKDALDGKVSDVRFTLSLKGHPVCLSSEGMVSIGMEKTLGKMEGEENHVKAQLVLEINLEHKIAAKLKSLYESDKEMLSTYTKILYAQARQISGLPVEDPSQISDLICSIIAE